MMEKQLEHEPQPAAETAFSARKYRVAGEVVGVGFRRAAQQRAESLGLRGWARNEADGSVVILAAGDEESLGRLAVFLNEGPPSARVISATELVVEEEDRAALPEKFEVH